MDLFHTPGSAGGGTCCMYLVPSDVPAIWPDRHADMVPEMGPNLSFSLYPISDSHETFRIHIFLIFHKHSIIFGLNWQRVSKFLRKIS